MTTIGNIGGCMTTSGNVVVASCILEICSDAREVGGTAIEVAHWQQVTQHNQVM